MRIQIKILLLIILTLIFMLGLWSVDIGASGAIIGAAGCPVQTEGLFFTRTPAAQYHLGLLISTASFLILCALFIFEIFREKGGKNEKTNKNKRSYNFSR